MHEVISMFPALLHRIIDLFGHAQFVQVLIDHIAAAAATLKTFAADPKWLGAKIGFYGILHTWGGKLQQHLHLHFIVTGGGLDAAGNWKHLKHKGRFIFPVCALSQHFRYRFLSGLKRAHKKGLLKFPGELEELESYDAFERWIFHTFPKKWVVYAKPPFKGPEQVVKYIGKYTHRVAISNRRILSVENDRVRFMYKNTRHKKARWEETSLPVEAFFRRFLMHILPHRYHRIRHFGILANGQCRENVKDIRQQLTPRVEYPDQDEEPDKMPCPNCKTGRMITQCIISVLGRIIYHRVDDSPAVIPVFEDTS
ncbi:MAG: IS91 family transposase [Desulfobacteraceae bacterium]|nr:IS91 family transposase [Desulfobacteraceae bacterium]